MSPFDRSPQIIPVAASLTGIISSEYAFEEDRELSRNHLEFYSILYDAESTHCPLVYVRDRRSRNGTYVNGRLIGRGPHLTTARLLQDGDTVTIQPHIGFHFNQNFQRNPSLSLSDQQRSEAEVNRPYLNLTLMSHFLIMHLALQ